MLSPQNTCFYYGELNEKPFFLRCSSPLTCIRVYTGISSVILLKAAERPLLWWMLFSSQPFAAAEGGGSRHALLSSPEHVKHLHKLIESGPTQDAQPSTPPFAHAAVVDGVWFR